MRREWKAKRLPVENMDELAEHLAKLSKVHPGDGVDTVDWDAVHDGAATEDDWQVWAEADDPYGIQLRVDMHAQWAARALIAFTDVVGGGEDLETQLSDLLGDLQHLADALGVDWDEAVRRGNRFYGEEILGVV
jgi:hypothetical protein